MMISKVLFTAFLMILPRLLLAEIQPVLGPDLFFDGGKSGMDVQTDASGNIYMAGYTREYPRNDPLAGLNAFLVKMKPNGKVIYSLIIGGSKDEFASSLAVDPSGNAIIVGDTESNDFPTKNAFQPRKVNQKDTFVVKVNSQGNVVYSTFLGGSSRERVGAVDVDADGNAYIVGETSSNNFPVVNPLQAQKSAATDVFITKLDPSGSPVYSTYLGGNNGEFAKSIAVDSFGNLVVGGTTCSSNFPTSHSLFSTLQGNCDGFVSKLDSTGTSLVFSTYFGGADSDQLTDLDLDSNGNIYLTGQTFSTNFPVKNAIQGANGGNVDLFVTKLNSDASTILFSTFLGGPSAETDGKLVVDLKGRVFVGASGDLKRFHNPIAGQSRYGSILILMTRGGKLLFSTPFTHSTVRNVGVSATGSKFYLAGNIAIQAASVVVIKKTVQ